MKRAKVMTRFFPISSRMISVGIFIACRAAWLWLVSPQPRVIMAKIEAFFNLMFEQKASDLHMASGNPPVMRINGELQRVDYPPLESDALKAMLYEIAPDYKIKVSRKRATWTSATRFRTSRASA